MQQYRPARKNLAASFVAAGLGAFSVWVGLYWPLGFIPAGFFFVSAAGLGYLATRPKILIANSHFCVGSETARWTERLFAKDVKRGKSSDRDASTRNITVCSRSSAYFLMCGTPVRAVTFQSMARTSSPGA